MIGSKSLMLKANGHRWPSQPTRSKGWMLVVVGGDPAAGLDLDDEVAGLGVGVHLGGWAEVPLAVRGVLEQLAELVAVALGRNDGRWRLDPQHPLRLALGRDHAVGGADGDDQVVAGAVVDRSEDRLQRAAPLVDEEHLVRLAVAVEAVHGLRRADDAEGDVLVEEQRDPALDCIAGWRNVFRVHQVMAMGRRIGPGLQRDLADLLDPVGAGGRGVVVQEGRPAAEALHPEQLLGVERTIRLAELGVALGRHLAALDVEHGALPF